MPEKNILKPSVWTELSLLTQPDRPGEFLISDEWNPLYINLQGLLPAGKLKIHLYIDPTDGSLTITNLGTIAIRPKGSGGRDTLRTNDSCHYPRKAKETVSVYFLALSTHYYGGTNMKIFITDERIVFQAQ